MYDIDFNIAEPMMNMNVEEAQPMSKARHRIVPQAGMLHRPWLSRQGCWLLCQMGHLLVAMGRRLEQCGLPRSLSFDEKLSAGA